MPPTRGHDLKPFAGDRRDPAYDAPHTGARLETSNNASRIAYPTMPPTRGHDLKLQRIGQAYRYKEMPPTRGHDLKHLDVDSSYLQLAMPPTRGHDLKHL